MPNKEQQIDQCNSDLMQVVGFKMKEIMSS